MAKLQGDETRPRGCKYPTPPCGLAKILPETTVRVIDKASPTTDISYFFNKSSLSLHVCIHAGNPKVPLRILTSGENPAEQIFCRTKV